VSDPPAPGQALLFRFPAGTGRSIVEGRTPWPSSSRQTVMIHQLPNAVGVRHPGRCSTDLAQVRPAPRLPTCVLACACAISIPAPHESVVRRVRAVSFFTQPGGPGGLENAAERRTLWRTKCYDVWLPSLLRTHATATRSAAAAGWASSEIKLHGRVDHAAGFGRGDCLPVIVRRRSRTIRGPRPASPASVCAALTKRGPRSTARADQRAQRSNLESRTVVESRAMSALTQLARVESPPRPPSKRNRPRRRSRSVRRRSRRFAKISREAFGVFVDWSEGTRHRRDLRLLLARRPARLTSPAWRDKMFWVAR